MTFRLRIPGWLLLLAFCSFFFYWRLASFGLIGADEPRYAQVAREMLERHDWTTPTLGGDPWLEKPPLYYWQAIVAYRLFGVSDWAARLPSVFDASLLAFALFWFLRRFRPGFELDGALILVTSAGIVGFSRAASTDMPLAATFSVAMLAWYAWFESGKRTSLALFYIFLALAVLAKGPVALFLAGTVIVIFVAWQRNLSAVWRSLSPEGIVLSCLVGLPWYILVQLRNPQFFRVFVLEHNLARFGTNLFHHPEPFWYYFPVSLLAWIPWSVFILGAMVWTVRRFRDRTADPLNFFSLIWIVVVIAFFSISQSKLPGYILPAVPAGALLLNLYLRSKSGEATPIAMIVCHALVSAALIFSALLIPHFLLEEHPRWNSGMFMPLALSLLVAGAMAAVTVKTGPQGLRMATLVPAVLALGLALRLGAGVLNERLSARFVSDTLAQLAPRPLPVAAVLISRETEYGLQFYRNQRIPRYELGQAPEYEHLVVAREGFQSKFAHNVPGRRVVRLGTLPSENLEFFYVSSK